MSDFISREAAIKLFNFAVLDCLGMEPTIRAGDIIKALESIPAADVREVVLCRDCWFFKKDLSFCSLHEADFAEDAFCSYATTDGLAEYWGLDKEDHDRKRRESGGNHFCADREKMEEK